MQADDPHSLAFIRCEQKFSLHTFHSFVKNQYLSNRVIRDLWLFLVLFVPTCAFMFSTNWASESFYVGAYTWGVVGNDELPPVSMEEGPTEGPSFWDTDSEDKWALWFESVLLPKLYNSNNPTASYPLGWTGIPGNNMLVGGVRVRYQKAEKVACPKSIADVVCYSSDFGRYDASDNGPLKYSACDSWLERRYGSVNTREYSHPCSGNSLTIPSNATYNQAVTTLRDILIPRGVADFRTTRFLVVEYITYNLAYDIFVYNLHWLQVSVAGKLLPSGNPFPFRLESESDKIFTYVMLGVVVLLFVHHLAQFVMSVWVDGLFLAAGQQLGVWHLLRFGSLVSYFTMFGYTFHLWVLESQLEKPILNAESSVSFPEQLAIYGILYNELKLVRAVTMVFVFLRILEFGALIPPVYMVTTAISRAARTILGACVLCAVCILAFAVSGYIIFGARSVGFHSVWAAIDSMSRMLVGNFDMEEIESQGRTVAIIFFWSYLVCCYFILLNFITAIISGAIEGMDTGKQGSLTRELTLRLAYFRMWKDSFSKSVPLPRQEGNVLRIDQYVEEYGRAYARDPRNFEHNPLGLVWGWIKFLVVLEPSENCLKLLTALLHNQPLIDTDLPIERIAQSVHMFDRAPLFKDFMGSYVNYQDRMKMPDWADLYESNPHLSLPKPITQSEFNYLWFIFITSSMREEDVDEGSDVAILNGLEEAWAPEQSH